MNRYIFYYILVMLLIFKLHAQDLSRLDNRPVYNPNLEMSGLFYSISDAGNNSELSEIGCTIFRNKYIISSNKQRGFARSVVNSDTGLPNYNIFCSDIFPNYTLDSPLVFSKVLNSKREQGGVTFFPDESAIFFVRSKPENSTSFTIYRGDLDKKFKYYWANLRELKINSPEYSIETPCVGKDSTKIYFSSNMPGGFDLYVGDFNEEGEIVNHHNLGETVNSEKDEKYPFIDAENKYLYFSSTGHQGHGKYDIYRVSVLPSGYQYRYNLGHTINTPNDDISFYLLNSYNGYVTSNSSKDENDFNIYKFQSTNINQEVDIKYIDAFDNKPIEGVQVTILNEFNQVLINEKRTNKQGELTLDAGILDNITLKSHKIKYKKTTHNIRLKNNNKGTNKHEFVYVLERVPFVAQVIDVDTKTPIVHAIAKLYNAKKELLSQVRTDENGYFYFNQMPPPPFYVNVNKDKYHLFEAKHDDDLTSGKSITKTISLIKIEAVVKENGLVENGKAYDIISVDNIFFDFDKSSIRKKSHVTLHQVHNLLKAKPNMKIVINAHTDSKGSEQYNLKLSKARALSVYRHLIKKGIKSTRLSYQYFGESKPNIDCGDNCTEKEDAENRRVQFVLE